MDIEAVECNGNGIKFFQLKFFRDIRRFINVVKTLLRWNVHCKRQLEYTESLMLANVKTPYKKFFVDLGNCVGSNDRIWTLAMNTELDHEVHTPMVLLHGYASALAFWMLNLDTFAAERPIYAVDLLGFGKSSRPSFSETPQEIEDQYVAFLEEWRKVMKLDKMILLAHSFGGWIACLYALRYPERVQHLILADPWGLDTAPCLSTHSFMKRFFLKVFTRTPPLNVIRAFGPFAATVFRNVRTDVVGKFESVMPDRHKRAISEYIYHCNSNKTTGERAFHSLLENGPWPKFPLAARMTELHSDIPLTFVYGEQSWIDSTPGYIIKLSRPNSYTHIEVVDGAGHKVFSDDELTFNSIVLKACKILKSNNVQ
ncbi:(Lyso)-N-acylphosphatidylethanolamine lipase-like [Chironomus tepperi]|uniref:(Lyso)-N-acylphosphatidylethanolamine lipase-like n=1 Tax=Chironomus tepperi TaxID=113505 RepID=UPI00391F269A